MRRFAAALLAAGMACSSPPVQPLSRPSPRPSPAPVTPSPTPEVPPRGGFPAPHAPVPRRAAALASEVLATNRALPGAVRSWLASGAFVPERRAGKLPPDGRALVFGALWQQRLYRAISSDPALLRRVLGRLPRRTARIVEEHAGAARGLRSLVTPIRDPGPFRITPPDPPRLLLALYKDSGRRYGIPWQVLASLNFVESKFGRFMGPSSAGALGPMQFMPATWDAYGNGGNVWSPRAAIPAAARYLAASGAPERMRDALFAYNRSWAYVDAIQTYARNIKRDPRNFYVYYFWQVFVVTTKGDLQLTGPGAQPPR